MANVQSAYGFRHIGFLSGAGPDYQLATRPLQSSNTNNIYFGDPVVKSGVYIIQATTANNTATIEGIFQGCTYIPKGGGAPLWSPYWPGGSSVDATAYIINAPNALFLAAALNTAISSTAIGDNILFNTGTGSTAGGAFSGATLDQSTITTNNNASFQLYSLYQGVGNGSDPTTPYNWAVVSFVNQRFRNSTGVT
jgi:hypothetical protein